MNLKINVKQTTVVIALAVLVSTACSGDYNPVDYPDDGGENIVSSFQAASDNSGVPGVGMAYLYQTGYHVDAITITRAGSTPRVIQFVTDTTNNLIQEAGGSSSYDDFWYDDQGRVSSYGRDGASVEYNDDGTISKTFFSTPDNSTTRIDEFAYAGGVYKSMGERLVSSSRNNILGGAVYNYAADGTLVSSRILTSETHEPSDVGYDFTTNQHGLVATSQKVPVGAFDIQFTPEYIFMTFDYDENKNLVKVENYSNEGVLLKTVDISYLPNTEPTPNIAGFMVITAGQFRDVFETY